MAVIRVGRSHRGSPLRPRPRGADGVSGAEGLRSRWSWTSRRFPPHGLYGTAAGAAPAVQREAPSGSTRRTIGGSLPETERNMLPGVCSFRVYRHRSVRSRPPRPRALTTPSSPA
jgi:hypothetical protein